jgi:hypothetical protein
VPFGSHQLENDGAPGIWNERRRRLFHGRKNCRSDRGFLTAIFGRRHISEMNAAATIAATPTAGKLDMDRAGASASARLADCRPGRVKSGVLERRFLRRVGSLCRREKLDGSFVFSKSGQTRGILLAVASQPRASLRAPTTRSRLWQREQRFCVSASEDWRSILTPFILTVLQFRSLSRPPSEANRAQRTKR